MKLNLKDYILNVLKGSLAPMYRKIPGGEFVYIILTMDNIEKRHNSKWNESDYLKLEDCRQLAEEKEMWFTELRVLLKEALCLLEYSDGKEEKKFIAVLRRIESLSDKFNMADEEFLATYKINEDLLSVMGRNAIEKALIDSYDDLSNSADAMASNLQYKIAILLWSAMKKLTLLVDISVDNLFTAAVQMAVFYGTIQRYKETIECYDEALKIANDNGIKTLEYCALIRKISFCLSSSHINESLNIDNVRLESMKMLTEMCEERNTTPNGVGESLIREEEKELQEADESHRKVIKRRISKVREAMPFIDLLLSCARGDSIAVANESSKIECAEKAINDNDVESAVKQIGLIYQMAYNSEDRIEAEECTTVQRDEENDNIFIPEKPTNLLKKDWLHLLQQMAVNETSLGHKDAAEMLCLLCQTEAASSYSDYHIAHCICMAGNNAAKFGDIDLAIANYKLAATIIETRDGTETDNDMSPYLYYMLPYHHALLLKDIDPHGAIELMTKAIDNIGYKERMVLVTSLFQMHLAEMYAMVGNVEKAEMYVRQSLPMLKKELAERLCVADVELKERIWMIASKQIEMAVRLLNENSSEQMRRAVYDSVLYAKGFLLSSENSVKRAVYEDGTESERALYEEIETIRDSLSPWGSSTDGNPDKYVQLYMKECKLLCELKNRVRKYYDFMDVEYEAIRAALGDSEIFIDCFDYERDGERVYVAFVYGRDDVAPRIIRLDLQRIAEQIKPDNKNNVWYVPSGELHLIPVESQIGHGIRRLSHARNIINRKDDKMDSIALFGGLDYGEENVEDDDIRGFFREMNEETVTPLLPWPKLKNTAGEVGAIEFMWKMCVNGNAVSYRNKEGSADRLMSLSGKHVSVIHIATHGFFETKKTKENLPVLAGTVRPMDMAGVVMSNGNRGWLHGDRLRHEGILLASDISKMDLQGTELVVLSACHSGNGTLKADGVYGLQRALKKAGARTLVISLWSEGDKEGCLFMKEFYSRMIGEGMERHQAFEEAKAEMKRIGVAEKYWAGFIMVD